VDYYLINSDGSQLHFPVNPQEIVIDGGKKIETKHLMNIGDVDFINGDRRSVITFESFFPAYYDTYCQYNDIKTPEQYWNQLVSYWQAGEPIRFMVTESPINTLVLIESAPYRLKGGEVGEYHFSLTMRTWKDVRVRMKEEIKTKVKSMNATRPRTDTKPVPKMYIVKSGDSLWKIAKMQLGSGSKWTSIYNVPENKKLIGPNPDVIVPGQKLVLPV
jgi:hypothetical protein